MSVLHSSIALWACVAAQILGLVSAWCARLSEGSTRQTPCQWVFFACLILVGIATMLALRLGAGTWLTSGGTLSLMVLTVTCDFNRAGRRGGWESY